MSLFCDTVAALFYTARDLQWFGRHELDFINSLPIPTVEFKHAATEHRRRRSLYLNMGKQEWEGSNAGVQKSVPQLFRKTIFHCKCTTFIIHFTLVCTQIDLLSMFSSLNLLQSPQTQLSPLDGETRSAFPCITWQSIGGWANPNQARPALASFAKSNTAHFLKESAKWTRIGGLEGLEPSQCWTWIWLYESMEMILLYFIHREECNWCGNIQSCSVILPKIGRGLQQPTMVCLETT